MSHKIDPSVCPCCESINNCATNTGPERVAPRPGDLAVCFRCGEVLRYDDRVHLRRIVASDIAEISAENLLHARQVSRRVKSLLANKRHSFAWSGTIPCTGVYRCVYCGKIEPDASPLDYSSVNKEELCPARM